MATSVISVLSKVKNLGKELQCILPNIVFRDINLPDKVQELKESEIIIADFDLLAPYAYDLRKTKWVQGTWAGIDALLPHIDIKNPPPYTITRFSGKYFGEIMAEYVIANVVNYERNFYFNYDNQKSSVWDQQNEWNFRILNELTFAVLGMGSIGNKIGETLNALGATVLGFGRSVRPAKDSSFLKAYYTKPDLPTLLSNCDYIVNVLPNTAETVGLLNGNILQNAQERKPVFVNIGRGSIISESELINALEKKWIRAAILDVFGTEPLPKDSKLWTMPQVRITPHIAGPTRAKEVAELFKINLQLFNEGKVLPLTVDFARGY